MKKKNAHDKQWVNAVNDMVSFLAVPGRLRLITPEPVKKLRRCV